MWQSSIVEWFVMEMHETLQSTHDFFTRCRTDGQENFATDVVWCSTGKEQVNAHGRISIKQFSQPQVKFSLSPSLSLPLPLFLLSNFHNTSNIVLLERFTKLKGPKRQRAEFPSGENKLVATGVSWTNRPQSKWLHIFFVCLFLVYHLAVLAINHRGYLLYEC